MYTRFNDHHQLHHNELNGKQKQKNQKAEGSQSWSALLFDATSPGRLQNGFSDHQSCLKSGNVSCHQSLSLEYFSLTVSLSLTESVNKHFSCTRRVWYLVLDIVGPDSGYMYEVIRHETHFLTSSVVFLLSFIVSSCCAIICCVSQLELLFKGSIYYLLCFT